MTILIIAHNQKAELQKCVESIRQYCDIDGVAVVVIDNYSDDGTGEWLAQQEDLAYATTEEEESIPQIVNQVRDVFGLEDDVIYLELHSRITPGCLRQVQQVLGTQEGTGALVLSGDVPEIMGSVDASCWDYILYMPRIEDGRSVRDMLLPLKNYSVNLKKDGKIKVFFPVMRAGEKPRYSYEDIFFEISTQGYILQEVNAVQFLCAGETVTGYDLILSKRKKQLLVLNSENPLISYNMNQIVEAYQRLGWNVIYSNPDGDLYKLLQQGIDRLFVINNVGWIANMGESTRNVWEQLGIASTNFILDHPMYYDDTLSQAPGNGTLLCVDENHVEYVKRFYPNINKCLFMPLAGDNALDGIKRAWEDREIEVLYVGGYKGSLERSLLPEGGERLLDTILQNRDCTVEEVIEKALRDKDESADEARVLQEIQKYRKVDWHVMTYIRVEVVRALVRGGVDVTVYGGGWEAFDEFDNPHFIYRGRTSQEECLEHMKNSKIVLNVMPWFKRGTHDRVINAMLAGAVALTDGSSYMDEVFEQGKDYVAYDIKHLERLPEIVRNILSVDNGEMRKRSYEKATREHRWIQRIAEMEGMLIKKE